MNRSIADLTRVAMLACLLLACLLAAPLAHAQKHYLTPEAAADALVKAMRANDTKAMQAVLGQNWKRFIPTDDLGRDDVVAFLAAWDQAHQIRTEGDSSALVAVGPDPAFTLLIPIVKNKAGVWKFDVVAGADRLRTARIGRNELAAMQAVLAYYDAQREYA
ncbi:MAG TPA: DUF2950 family protein, partial [Burkholderiaceae bacterium]|nr:DUF2950 family protein [Burkholderiaceae bacterium]